MGQCNMVLHDAVPPPNFRVTQCWVHWKPSVIGRLGSQRRRIHNKHGQTHTHTDSSFIKDAVQGVKNGMDFKSWKSACAIV